jgi:hypothetical protein
MKGPWLKHLALAVLAEIKIKKNAFIIAPE